MSDENNKKNSLFRKVLSAGDAWLDAQIFKAKTQIMNQPKELDEDFLYGKAVLEDPTYAIHSQGWKERPSRLLDSHLKQMRLSDVIIASVIQTRQNQVAAHSKLVKSDQERGWMLKLKDEEKMLEDIKEKLRQEAGLVSNQEENPIKKAEANTDEESSVEVTSNDVAQDGSDNATENAKSDDEVEQYDFELERKAKDQLRKQFSKAMREAESYVLNCGRLENRPFESKKWNLDSALRAFTNDTLTWDRYASEVVPDKLKRPHYWFPVDGGTIKYASEQLKNYKELSENFLNLDILYPERKVEAMEKQKILELNDQLLEKDAYKYVQVVRGRVERAYTADELKVGIRNITTDIYSNGYGLSELELLIGMVTGHLNAEYYNQAYFTQGFSAKGILHIKAAINRRKLEMVRQQWQHMVRGAKNSFQTPIFAGVEDVSWIPLTQNHNDIGFEGWMRYLIRMICSIYQIDPHEIGIALRDEGGGGGLSGDNTKEKVKMSKDKGLVPLLRHFENFINENILSAFDNRFIFKFTGITEESRQDALERQEKEVKFKKTVNEIRAEDGLPPLPGMDDIILDAQYMVWYNAYSDKAIEKQTRDQENQMKQMQMNTPGEEDKQPPPPDEGIFDSNIVNDPEMDIPVPGEVEPKTPIEKSINKSLKNLKVEYYKIKE